MRVNMPESHSIVIGFVYTMLQWRLPRVFLGKVGKSGPDQYVIDPNIFLGAVHRTKIGDFRVATVRFYHYDMPPRYALTLVLHRKFDERGLFSGRRIGRPDRWKVIQAATKFPDGERRVQEIRWCNGSGNVEYGWDAREHAWDSDLTDALEKLRVWDEESKRRWSPRRISLREVRRLFPRDLY